MSSMHSLNLVVEMAEKRRDEALATQARLQRELREAQGQMDQLQAYATEAEQRWALRSSQGVDTTMLMNHRQFMQKIHHAIDFQTGVLRDRQVFVERGQTALIDAERELAGLRKYIERQQQALALRAHRLDQKRTDEMAQNIHRRQQAEHAAMAALAAGSGR